MKTFFIISFFLFLINCSLNKDSNYWTENKLTHGNKKEDRIKIVNDTKNVLQMTIQEYEIFLNDHVKKNSYPDLKNE